MEIIKINLKLIILVVFFSGVNSKCDKQIHSNVEIFYLIGLFNDYGGRDYIPSNKVKKFFITDFYAGQVEALEGFKSVISSSSLFEVNNFIFETDNNENPIITVYSEKYADVFNEFYSYKKAEFLFVDENDNEYEFYKGKLKKSKFKTSEQKLYFLKGAFDRNGHEKDGIYTYKFGNSQSKFELVKLFLKETGSLILTEKTKVKTVPSIQEIDFVPSKEFENLIYGFD